MNTIIWTLIKGTIGNGLTLRSTLPCLVAFAMLPGLAGATERVEYDPGTGNYIVEYFDEDEGQVQMVIEPPNKVIAMVRARATRSTNLRLGYEYLLEVAPTSPQSLYEMRILVPPGVSDSDVSGPPGWDTSFAELWQHAWWSAVGSSTHGIRPGGSERGFRVAAASLPAVVQTKLEGWNAPPGRQYGRAIAFRGEPPESIENAVNAIRRDPTKWTKLVDIVGPVAVPNTFAPLQFTDHLLDLKNRSVALGWIKDAAASEELGGKLSAISGQLSALTDNKIPLSKGTKILELGAQFLQFVESNSCKDFDCAEPRPLTSESYALLFYNMDYFLSQVRKACEQPAQLPPPFPTPAPKRKK